MQGAVCSPEVSSQCLNDLSTDRTRPMKLMQVLWEVLCVVDVRMPYLKMPHLWIPWSLTYYDGNRRHSKISLLCSY